MTLYVFSIFFFLMLCLFSALVRRVVHMPQDTHHKHAKVLKCLNITFCYKRKGFSYENQYMYNGREG